MKLKNEGEKFKQEQAEKETMELPEGGFPTIKAIRNIKRQTSLPFTMKFRRSKILKRLSCSLDGYYIK